MAGKVRKALEREVTCPLCLDLFKEPKKLPCDHVYCKDCLKGLALRSLNHSISCPECRTNTNVPNGNVNDFPTAFRMNRLIEAFQETEEERDHGKETTDGPTSCTAHPAQPLALYCETCKTMLCRDCVIMNKDHEQHNYDYIDKVAEKCREKHVSRLQKTKEYKESLCQRNSQIAKAATRIVSHETENLEKIDSAFEALQNTLELRKQSMKRQLSLKHQEALNDLVKHRTHVENTQAEIARMSTLIEETLNCHGNVLISREEHIEKELVKVQNTMEQIPLTVEEPALPVPNVMSCERLKKHLDVETFLSSLADPRRCQIQGSLLTSLRGETGKSYVLTMVLLDSEGKKCLTGDQQVTAELISVRDGRVAKATVKYPSPGHVSITFTPQQRGRKKLVVRVRGQDVSNSPQSIFIHTSPMQEATRPVTQIQDLDRPAGITHCGNTVLVLEFFRNRVLKLNTSFELVSAFGEATLRGPAEIATDQNSNIYVTTVQDHKVHKFSYEGVHIKAIGTHGFQPGQFDYPNGLRVNNKEELYICDSKNGRIQVFDLDFNFKRIFGCQGKGKGQLSFPSDVDFDRKDNVYIADHRNHRIQVFTPGPQEQFIRIIGHNRFGSREIERPLNMHIVKDHLYMTDYDKGCIVVYKLSGELVTTIGKGVLDKPEGIEIDEDGYTFVTSHFSKVAVF